jgi:hypothetical protein
MRSAEIYEQALYSSKGKCELAGLYATDNNELHKNGGAKVRIHVFKRPSIGGSLS